MAVGLVSAGAAWLVIMFTEGDVWPYTPFAAALALAAVLCAKDREIIAAILVAVALIVPFSTFFYGFLGLVPGLLVLVATLLRYRARKGKRPLRARDEEKSETTT